MTHDELAKALMQFDGFVTVQAAGLHTMPDGTTRPSISVNWQAHAGPGGLGRALGAIISAYISAAEIPNDVPPEEAANMKASVVATVINAIIQSVNTAEMVSIQVGGVS